MRSAAPSRCQTPRTCRPGHAGGTGWEMPEAIDSMLQEGLTCATGASHMRITGGGVASRYHISRADQDAFAFESQRRRHDHQWVIPSRDRACRRATAKSARRFASRPSSTSALARRSTSWWYSSPPSRKTGWSPRATHHRCDGENDRDCSASTHPRLRVDRDRSGRDGRRAVPAINKSSSGPASLSPTSSCPS
jgi:hypothetical protein